MIETVDNVTKITPLQPYDNTVSQESIESCINIARLNALNKRLFCNCYNASCSIYDHSQSKCVSNGNLNASIMFVDAFPSEYESFTGALTDEKGYLLEESIKNTNVKRSDIYCANLIKCFNVQDTNVDIINNCLENYFYKEFDLVKPKKIIFTYSAFQAGLKYNIIPYTGNVNYFTKIKTVIRNLEIDMFIVYDMKTLNEQQKNSFKQGMQIILQ